MKYKSSSKCRNFIRTVAKQSMTAISSLYFVPKSLYSLKLPKITMTSSQSYLHHVNYLPDTTAPE